MNKKKLKRKTKSKKALSSPPAEKTMPSLQSMEGFLGSFAGIGRNKRSAVNEAQQVIYEAWEAPTRPRAITLARRALAISVDCADAHNILAEETARSLEEAIDLYQKGVEAGERALGKKAFKEDVGCFWGLLETRPYM